MEEIQPWLEKARNRDRCNQIDQCAFLSRDAVLARYLLSSCVRPSVRPPLRTSVTNRHCIKTTVRIELVLAWRLPSTHPTPCRT